MIEADILVIGGSAGGILTATTAKRIYPDKKIVMVRKNKTVMVPCGIPYIFGTLYDTSKNRIPDEMVKSAGVELLIDEVISIDKDKKSGDFEEWRGNQMGQTCSCNRFTASYSKMATWTRP